MFGKTQTKNLRSLSQQIISNIRKYISLTLFSIITALGAASLSWIVALSAVHATSFEIKDLHANRVGAYQESYALLIGVQDYTGYWQDLDNVPEEIHQIESILMQEHFHLNHLMNPTGQVLKEQIKAFFQKEDRQTKMRLLLFFQVMVIPTKKSRSLFDPN
ncbi:MAG: hypothetical protein OMM_01130 [Candidatus Magnetoglobus multicellularis str. Araruama]|uniref:Peptidase C14 caspase domain-containing protein n=1 Tax=Candidatus Magnetoglobus multicellularis str. Araruama TaxID=890399 RepID=A0A1V1PEI3_9BACT|nr:MAG: hypothetical protein OMM_01130 [Candidatus Magnetoglobus multicellularis str. Araruama]